VHRVLCDFYTKTSQIERTEERLIRIFDESWAALSRGFLRMEGVDALREASIRQLQNYIARFDYSREPYMVEPYFQVDFEPGITLFGRLDRLDEEPDGTLEIIDYKAGSMPGDVDPGQLVFYAIMVEEKLNRPVSKASFWYLDDGSVWTMKFSDDDRRKGRGRLLATVHQMLEARSFPPTIGERCGSCPFLHACEFGAEIEARRRVEGW
jgi:CRISPR/Cas system-associated exonuclease Cas4 (RecB family)